MRNLISSSPGLALAMGALLGAPARHGRLVATGLVLIGFAVGAGELLVPAHERPDYTAAARYVERTGARSDPVAVISAPTPGPLSAMDAAFTYTGERGRPLLRIGTPTLSATLSAPPYALLPAPPATALAAQAARVKAGGQLFVVAPGTVSAQALLRSAPIDPIRALGPAFGSGTSGALFARVFTPLSAFMRALSPDFALAGTRRFQGMLPLSVYVFTRR